MWRDSKRSTVSYHHRVPTFDVVSLVDMQEVRNAVDQASREITQRYDFKGTGTSVTLKDDGIVLESSAEGRLDAAVDVLKEKLVRRKVSLKVISGGVPQPSGGGRSKAVFTLTTGLDSEAAREIAKAIRGFGTKVQAQIQGDLVRVTGKKRDELQGIIEGLRGLDYRLPLQFVNYRD